MPPSQPIDDGHAKRQRPWSTFSSFEALERNTGHGVVQVDSGRCSPVSEAADELGDIKQEGDLWQSGAGKSEADAGDGGDSHGIILHMFDLKNMPQL